MSALPACLLVRRVTFEVPVKGWRTQQVTVATTLLDDKAWPAAELAERLSFKGALDALRQWSPAWAWCGLREGRRMLEAFFESLGGLVLPLRPGRAEPRARKTRPKNYPLLGKPRGEFIEIPHRSKYRKPELALS